MSPELVHWHAIRRQLPSVVMLSTARFQILALLTGVLIGGPVAACFCVEDISMAAMPCCPDQPAASDHDDAGTPPLLTVACVPLTDEDLIVDASEIPALAAIAPAHTSDHSGLDPPGSIQDRRSRAFDSGSPLYLTTRRLRI